MKFPKRILFAVIAVSAVLSFAGCDDGDESVIGGGSNAVGCANLKAGTRCSESSACSQHFLCLTGQGRDSNCSDGCSCQ